MYALLVAALDALLPRSLSTGVLTTSAEAAADGGVCTIATMAGAGAVAALPAGSEPPPQAASRAAVRPDASARDHLVLESGSIRFLLGRRSRFLVGEIAAVELR
jgi:hypothetical protein